MTALEILGIIGTIFGIIGVIVAVVSFTHSNKKETKNDGKETGSILTELGYIKSSVDDIKRKQESTDEKLLNISTNNAKFGSFVDEANRRFKDMSVRLDKIDERLNDLDK